MGSSVIGQLRILLGLETAAFETGSKRVRRDLSTTDRAAERTKKLLGGLFSGLAVGAMVAAAQRALEYAGSLGEVAQQLGVTTKTLQEYRYAAGQVGIEHETLDKGLAKLTKSIGLAATGSEKERKVFKALGIDIHDAAGNVRDAGDIFPQIADALNKIPDPARRAAVEVALFGKSGQKLDTLLAGGSAAINQLRDAAHKLGLVLSDEQIHKADEAADKFR
ncbi:MAG: phage tail tape measure protein, partial [Allosphingosinicella sp.]